MNILNKFTLKSISKNRKRTIVTIIGIALSTALICAVAGMCMSLKKTAIDMMIKSDGNFHIRFNFVPKEELKYIENNKQVSSYFFSTEIGYAKLENSANDYKPYLYVQGFSDEAMENSGLKLEKGRLPENDGEVVISDHIISNARVQLDVGDTLKLKIGNRQSDDGVILHQNNPYQLSDEGILSEKLIENTYKEYKIVGIIERLSFSTQEQMPAPGYTIITRLTEEQILENDLINISVHLREPGNRKLKEEFIDEITKKDSKIRVTTNSELLRYEGDMSDNNLRAIYSIAGIIIGIIIVSSVFVIRNSFNISISEKTKQYGMFSSIGATSKQIRKTVFMEATFIGLIGIPLGIIIGIIAVVILVWIINILLANELLANGFKFIYGLPSSSILITCISSLIIVYLSALIPAIRASRITPIDAIRESKDIKIKAKNVRTSLITKKIFGIGGVIAVKNLKRSRKKYRTTVISLVVSISIFIALSSFLQYGKKMTNSYYVDYDYNIVVQDIDYESDKTAETKNLYEEIVKEYDLTDYSYGMEGYGGIVIDNYATEDYNKYIKQDVQKNDAGETQINIIKLNKEYFKKYLDELGLKEDVNTVILMDNTSVMNEDGSIKNINLYNIKDGQSMIVNVENTGNKEFDITKVTEEKPMGYERATTQFGYLFISEENPIVDSNMCILNSLNIKTDEPDELEANLVDKSKSDNRYSNLTVFNIEQNLKAEQRVILLISIFLYGFITVITLIGVTNIFNTITTNMILRSKEFAMLKSIGMTKKEFNRMIRLESILYGLKSLIIGIPIGIGLAYCIYRSFAINIEFKFEVPWNAILIATISVILIVGLTMKYSLSKINKNNIVETIRNDNI